MANERVLPEKWQSSQKAMKAVQVAFDMDEKIQYTIRKAALDNNLSPSEQIRDILGLAANKRPKRPRLTVSFNQQDYITLSERYGLSPDQQLDIKRLVSEELERFSTHLDIESTN